MNPKFLLILACFCAVFPIARAEQQVIHDPGAKLVTTLKLQPLNPLPGTNELHLAIGLPLRNTAELTNLLAALYDPANPLYRHYLTLEQFTDRFGPTKEHYDALVAFAEAHGLRVTKHHANRIVLDVSGSIDTIERTFNVTLNSYSHPGEPRTFYAPDVEPSLEIGVPVLSVSGLNDYALPRPRRIIATPVDQLKGPRPLPTTADLTASAGGPAVASTFPPPEERAGESRPFARPQLNSMTVRPLLGSGPGGTYMGNDFRSAYVPNVTLTGAGQTLALVEFDGFNTKDITSYEALANLSRTRIRAVYLDGFKGTAGGGNVEVALDIEVAMSMAPGLAEILVYEAGPSGNWHDMLNAIATDNSAKQISCSWYMPGAGADPTSDQIFQQMAAQGQSFLNASGDYDAYSGFIDFPGATPYITQVGGTTLTMTTNGAAYESETVWNWNDGIGTGGGVTTNYTMPSWQQVINFGTSHGSSIYRNVPDVAMTADNVFVVANNGQQLSVGGTSCAAPLWAAFIALVNQQAATASKPSVGFINPAVYALGSGAVGSVAFHDIVTGNNTNSTSLTDFFAVPGYDLCTGWGTPNGQELITALANTDGLAIIGPNGFASGGPAGGPFSVTTQNFTLTNQGTAAITWQASSNASWLTISPASGSLSANQRATITVSLNAAASNLNAGFYSESVWFTNNASGFIQPRQFALAIAQSAYGGAVLSLIPAAYWPLNETNALPPADVITNSGSLGRIANAFGLANPVQAEQGIVGHSFRFSNPTTDITLFGSHADVPFHSSLNPNGAFTVELWAKPAQAVPDYFCPAASVDASRNSGTARYGWVLYQTPTNWEFRVGGGDVGYAFTNSGGGSPVIGSWTHLVGVYDGANSSLFVNGQLVDGPGAVTGFAPNTNITIPLRIGATTFPNRTFDGWVDEVAFYGQALAADRVAAHYNTASSNPASYEAQVLADQPIGYWHLDEPAYVPPGVLPTAVNLGFLGSAANGTYEPGSIAGVPGIPSLALGPNNLACSLAGSGYVDLAGWALNFTGPLTLVLWTKPDPANGNDQLIAGKGGASYRILLDGLGYPHFGNGTQPFGDLAGATRIDDGAWHQLVGVYDGTNSQFLYVDGQLAASTNGAIAPVTGNANDLYLGANVDIGLYQLYNGVVDEITIFTNALSSAQISQLFSAAAYSRPSAPLFQTVQRNGTSLVLTWSAVAGRSYQVQYSTALSPAIWNNLGAVIPATNSTASASDLMIDSQRFYRVVLLP